MLSLRSLFPIALLCGLFHCQPAKALGGPDPDFVNGALVIESFDDEYAPGSVPTTSPIAIERAPGSDRFWTIYAVYGAAPGSRSLGLMRHHLDGSLDESFGVSGNPGMRLVSWPTASSDFTPAEAGMGSDSKLLVAGYVRNLDNPGLFDVVACRLLAFGSFDSNFGDSGCRRLPVLSDNGTLFTIDMVPDLTGGAYMSGWNQSAGR
ncbi:MAG: hypothetical protein KDI75_08725 [Xanthomonadales bacterium]|nr:hypothetical protein [Xanthomonadales bacterium]